MGQTIGQILPFAIGIAISPMPIIAIILMLITPKARTNGLAFLVGWVLGLVVIGALLLVVAATAGLSDSSGGSPTTAVIKLLLGLLLLLAAVRQWRSRPAEGETAPMPKWMQALDGFTTPKSFGLAFLLSGINPKNLMLNMGAMATIAGVGLSGGQQAVTLLVFACVASLTIATPVGVYLTMGDRAGEILGGWKAWLAANNPAVMAVLFVVFGFVLIGQGISGLSS
jgi:hypothetical protein